MDSASDPLLAALFGGHVIQAFVYVVYPAPGGGEVQPDTVEVKQGMLVSFTTFSQNGTRLERVGISPTSEIWDWYNAVTPTTTAFN